MVLDDDEQILLFLETDSVRIFQIYIHCMHACLDFIQRRDVQAFGAFYRKARCATVTTLAAPAAESQEFDSTFPAAL